MLISATFVLVLTAAFSFGILAGYAVVLAILHAFARSRQEEAVHSTQYPVPSTE